MAYASQVNTKGVFEFGGLHFKPSRKITKSERHHFGTDNLSVFKDDRFPPMRNMQPDMDVGLSIFDWKKADYSRDSFYVAANGSKCDLFRCIENGKLYYPGDTQLFQYTEFSVYILPKVKQTQKKLSLQDKLDAAKETARKAAANNDTRGGKLADGLRPKKRSDMEVD